MEKSDERRSVLLSHGAPCRPAQFSSSFGARVLGLLDLVAEDSLESFSDSFGWPEADQVREAARPRQDHVMG